jgi:outer membrane protein
LITIQPRKFYQKTSTNIEVNLRAKMYFAISSEDQEGHFCLFFVRRIKFNQSKMKIRGKQNFLLLINILIICISSFGQQKIISLKDIPYLVEKNQPQLQAFKDQTTAASQDINLARNSFVPDATIGYQANYTTFNNITGMSYPGLMMPITGPPFPNDNINFVPGTALAMLIKWEPITFGQRNAAVQKAAAQFQMANASYSQSLFKQQYAALYTYLEAVYLHQIITSAEANVNRIEIVLSQSLVLSKEGLRPGIDTIQFQRALAGARVSFYSAEKAYELQLEELTRLTGLMQSSSEIILSDTAISDAYPQLSDTTNEFAGNPLLQYYQSKQEFTKAALRDIQTMWRPHLDFWGNAYGRGSGVEYNGVINKSDGWNLSRTNYGAGLQLSFPILQFSQINIQKKQYQSMLKADEEMVNQSKLDLHKQFESALISFQRNENIAKQTVLQQQLAGNVNDGLVLAYKSGLTDYTSLAQGQFELLNADISKANAYLQMWHALLDIAVAKGDINIFLRQLK